MSVRSRIKRLEVFAVKKLKRRIEEFPEEQTLDEFTKLGKQGYFKREPDFPVALDFFRNALAKATAQTHPPWNPPHDFLPRESRFDRLMEWRYPDRFPEVRIGFLWLAEMRTRIEKGTPPVTEAEFNDLARWFHEHHTELELLSNSQIFDFEDGRTTTTSKIVDGLQKGCRMFGAGQLAQDLRHLKSLYTERLGDGRLTPEREGSGFQRMVDGGRGMDPGEAWPPDPPAA
jgi:hypothetical protein